MELPYSMSTRSLGDGSEPEYVVYFEQAIVARFPINDPSSPDANEYAVRFIDAMNGYYLRRRNELVTTRKQDTFRLRRQTHADCK